MKPLGIAGPSTARATLRERVVADLAELGDVGVVTSNERRDHAHPDAAIAYGVGRDGRWTATGTGADPTGILDQLAPRVDYAVVTGFPSTRIPHIVVGNTEFSGDVLLQGSSPDDIHLSEVRDALAAHEPFETLESLVTRVKAADRADRAGAIATFTGRVRERDHPDDDPTTRLEFEKYEGIAEERLDRITTELEARDGVYAVELHHRTGPIEAGQDIVFVVVLAGHREEAFRTVQDGINRLKAEVPIFKKEVTLEEEYWVHKR